jgi:DNA-directed RNA polymerase subunit N (RpoN/RPB10)
MDAPFYRNPVTIEPVCTCKTVIGHVYPIYRRIYQERMNEEKSAIMGDVLDSLGIKRMCCRSKILSHLM